jgi:hypothetical protein
MSIPERNPAKIDLKSDQQFLSKKINYILKRKYFNRPIATSISDIPEAKYLCFF